MNDLLSEPRLSLTQLAKRENVSISTVWRWTLGGCKGHILESFRVGGRTYTTEDAFERWIVKLNAGKAATYVTTRQRQRQIEAAERECDRIFGPIRKKTIIAVQTLAVSRLAAGVQQTGPIDGLIPAIVR